MGCRHVAVLVGCAGCLIADAPDGTWRPLTNECVPLAGEATAILRDERYLHVFAVSGDTIVFDDEDGFSQLSLRDRSRALIARTTSDDVTDFRALADDLLYYAAGVEFGSRDLVVDRGVDEYPRWLTIASFSEDDFALLHASPAGVFWRSDTEAKWERWKRDTNTIVPSGMPDDAFVTSSRDTMFYRSAGGFFTLPVDALASTLVAPFDEFATPVGLGEGRPFIWHQSLPNTLDEVTPTGLRTVTTIPTLPVPGRRAFGGGYFYWVPIADSGPDSIRRVRLDGGPQETVATVGSGEFGTIQADACNIYWQVVRETRVDLFVQSH